MKRFFIVIIIGALLVSSCKSSVSKLVKQEPTLKGKLEILFPGAEINSLTNLEGYEASYQIVINQPLDHEHPEKGTFKHYLYLSHLDYNKPMVLETEGYSARYVKNELSEILNANQLIVEYRFYGKSRPDPIPWEFLTNDQAIADYHSLVTRLKLLYTGKWISTGISKGGETTLIYRSKYPEDMDIAVPYVAPLINTQEDPRTTAHINSVGSEVCRERIIDFQRALLENRTEVLKEMHDYAEEKSMTFTKISLEEALEYAALEFSFSFWQWGGKCDEIPGNEATSKELFMYMNRIVGINFYNDATYYDLLPSYYQHMIELGYYGFDMAPISDLLQVVKSPSNKRFAPEGVDLTYNPDYIKTVRDYVEQRGNRILYIYGALDPWGACGPTPEKGIDALKMVLPGGHHGTRIRHFPKTDRETIRKKLSEWLAD